MAKQKGLQKIAGRVDDQSFYYSKNGGYQMRKINPGMSSRVKTAKEYANTRLNNAEFGGSGSVAGAIVRGISQRWRFILSPIATGTLVKAIKKAMLNDTTSAWGQRTVKVADMPLIQEKLTALSKNALPEEVASFVRNEFIYDSSEEKISTGSGVDLSDESKAELKAQGANGVAFKVYGYNVTAPTPAADGETYEAASYVLAPIAAAGGDVDFSAVSPEKAIKAVASSFELSIVNEATHFGGVLVIALPYRKIGSNKYTLQELCSCVWAPATPGDLS